jgi:hypothetical protein
MIRDLTMTRDLMDLRHTDIRNRLSEGLARSRAYACRFVHRGSPYGRTARRLLPGGAAGVAATAASASMRGNVRWLRVSVTGVPVRARRSAMKFAESERPPACLISAIVPATCGADMDVPAIDVAPPPRALA